MLGCFQVIIKSMDDPEINSTGEQKLIPSDAALRDLAWSKYAAIDSIQYSEAHESLQSPEHITPLVYKHGEQRLTLIASRHVDTEGRPLGNHDYNPNSAYHTDLDRVFDNYLATTPPAQRLAIVEGTIRPTFSRDQAISIGSETGHLCFYAQEHGIPVVSGEPSEAQLQAEMFAAGVTKTELTALYAVWSLGSLIRTTGSAESLGEHLLDKANQAGLYEDSGDQDLSPGQKLTKLVPALNATLGRDWFAWRDGRPVINIPDEVTANSADLEQALADAWWPDRPGRINEVSRLSSDLRDKYLFDLVIDQVKAGKSPIVPFGSTHVARLKSSFDTYFGSSAKLELASLPKPEIANLSKAFIDQGASLEQDGGLEVYIADDPEALLDWAVANNYILHGSTRRITTDFTPQLADDSSKESGNRTAVYMVDIPPLAMFKALTGGIMGSYTTHHGSGAVTIDEHGNRSHPQVEFAISDPDIIAQEGYVYIFDAASSDEHLNGEFLSYKPIHPVAVIKINRHQFKYPIEHLNA